VGGQSMEDAFQVIQARLESFGSSGDHFAYWSCGRPKASWPSGLRSAGRRLGRCGPPQS
jgi:hypothetical protein